MKNKLFTVMIILALFIHVISQVSVFAVEVNLLRETMPSRVITGANTLSSTNLTSLQKTGTVDFMSDAIGVTDNTGGWIPSSTARFTWVEVNFGVAVNMNSVKLYKDNGGTSAYTYEIKTKNSSADAWTTVATGGSYTVKDAIKYQNITFSSTIKAKYIRIEATWNDLPRFTEIEVMGNETQLSEITNVQTVYSSEKPNIGVAATVTVEGKSLEGNVTYKRTEYEWQKSLNENFDTPIILKSDDASPNQYTFVSEDIGYYIRCKISSIISIDSGPEKIDQIVFSNTITLPSPPMGTNPVIKGYAMVGNVLTADYSFNDINGDTRGENTYFWGVSSSPTIKPTEFGEMSLSYKIKNEDVGKYVWVKIIPMSTVQPYQGIPIFTVYTENTYPTAVTENFLLNELAQYCLTGVDLKNVTEDLMLIRTTPNNCKIVWSSDNTGILGNDGTVTRPQQNDVTINLIATISKEEKTFEYLYEIVVKKAAAQLIINRGNIIDRGSNSTTTNSVTIKGAIDTPKESKLIDQPKEIKLTDVANNFWAYTQINEMVNDGILSGDSGTGNIRPNDNILREEVATVLLRALKISPKAAGKIKDGDNSSAWAEGILESAKEAGIMQGDSNEFFNGANTATRTEVIVMIARAKDIQSTNTDILNQFSDTSNIPDWSKKYIAGMIERKILTGYNDGTLRLKNNISRAETFVLIHRLINK